MRTSNRMLCGSPASQEIKRPQCSEINAQATLATPESNPAELKRHAVYHAPEYIGKRVIL